MSNSKMKPRSKASKIREYRSLTKEMKSLRIQIEAYNSSDFSNEGTASDLSYKKILLLNRYYSFRHPNVRILRAV